jgi:hypothetical protein
VCSSDLYDGYADGLRAIVVGGQALSRGLTLEGLIVSYMYRNSMAYDTLMQMGRWFGYRKNYDDLCRIYLDADSQAYYESISEANDELRSEIKRMKDRNATPLEFGLKVRNDPEVPLIVTARNKMRLASRKRVTSSLSSVVIETPYLFNDSHENEVNLNLVRELLSNLTLNKEDGKQFGAKDVDLSLITSLLDNISVPGSNITFDPTAVSQFIKKYAGNELKQWDIVFVSGSSERAYDISDSAAIKESLRSFDLRNDNKFIRMSKSKTRLGSVNDSSYGLTTEQKQIVKDVYGPKLRGDHYFKEVVIDRNPLLMIYLVELKNDIVNPNDGLADFGDKPLVGFGIGIPFLSDEKTKYIDYQTNRIYQELGGFDDESDEGVEND